MSGSSVSAGLLGAVVAAPLAMAALLAGLRASGRAAHLDAWARSLGLATQGAVLAGALALFAAFDATDTRFQFVTFTAWLPRFGVHWFAGLDGIGLLLVLLTSFLFPVALLGCQEAHARDARFVAGLLALQGGLLGGFASLNLFQLVVFQWLALLPAAGLLSGFGGPGRTRAALHMLGFGFAASLLVVFAALCLTALPEVGSEAPWPGSHARHGLRASLDLATPPVGAAARGVSLLDVPPASQAGWIFLAFALGFALQGPLVPVHLWLPRSQVAAPAGLDALLGGVLAKLGLYGFLRVALPLLPDAAARFAPLLAGLVVLAVAVAAVSALRRTDVKAIVAALSVGHLALPLLGFATLGLEGIQGGVLHLLSHGLAFGALLLLVGMLEERRGTRELSEFGGIARPMPGFGLLFVVAVIGAAGLPLLGGFVGQLLVLVAAFEPWPAQTALAVLSLSGIAAAALRMTWRLLFGPVGSPANRGLIDLGLRERLAVGALLLPLLWLGLHPASLLSRLEPSVGELRRRMEERSAAPAEARLPAHEALAAIAPGARPLHARASRGAGAPRATQPPERAERRP